MTNLLPEIIIYTVILLTLIIISEK